MKCPKCGSHGILSVVSEAPNNMKCNECGHEELIVAFFDSPSLKDAVRVLCYALKIDEAYFQSWQANIAMAFQDTWNKTLVSRDVDPKTMHRVANDAAKMFLYQLINTKEN